MEGMEGIISTEITMHPVCLHDKNEIETFLRLSPAVRCYELGDLDDFFWPNTP
jgi:hypothetical protein